MFCRFLIVIVLVVVVLVVVVLVVVVLVVVVLMLHCTCISLAFHLSTDNCLKPWTVTHPTTMAFPKMNSSFTTRPTKITCGTRSRGIACRMA